MTIGRSARLGRGRDAGYPAPPAQIRASAPNAHGSYLGCLDAWTQSAPPDTDAGSRLPGSSVRVFPEIAPSSSGCVDSAGEVATTTCGALRAETPSFVPRSAAPQVLEIAANHRLEPLRRATPYLRACGSYGSSPSPTDPHRPGCGWPQGLSVLACPEGPEFPCMPGVYDSAVPATHERGNARRSVAFRLT